MTPPPVVKMMMLLLVAAALGVVSGGVQALAFNKMEDRRVDGAGKDVTLHLNPMSLAVSTGVGMVLVTLLMEFGRRVM